MQRTTNQVDFRETLRQDIENIFIELNLRKAK